MTVEIKPETEQLLREESLSGHVDSLDELILHGVRALRGRDRLEVLKAKPRKKLYDLLTQPPFAHSELVIDREKDYPRPVDLD